MLSPISCTTPNEPGLMYSTRRRLEELARLDDDAPGDAELGVEEVGAGGKDYAADGCVGECTGQVRAGAHRSLQLTAVVGH